VDFLAGLLGLRKVGWVFTQAVGAAERDYIMSGSEVAAMAAMQVGEGGGGGGGVCGGGSGGPGSQVAVGW
jgi:hypothetical protein